MIVTIIDAIKELYEEWSGSPPLSLDVLPQSGSDRRYFRLCGENYSVIATHGINVRENEVFIYFSNHFAAKGLPTAKILAVNDDTTVYLQEDFGDDSLLTLLEAEGYTKRIYGLFAESLKQLAHLQVNGHEELDYDQCLTNKEFGKQAIMADLLYFKYYFLDTLKIAYDKEKLVDDFEALSIYLAHVKHKYFMFRDFQSRNILIKHDEVHFIDYQGGMKGALQYDVASLLWQAKANLPDKWKNFLLDYYMDCVSEILKKPLDRNRFVSQYNGYVLIRLLQVLGAYGFRGLFERKAHFLISIPLALTNLKWFLDHKETGIALPEFEKVLQVIVQDNIVEKFRPVQANESTPLVVTINSFSYVKSGYPKDESIHGGGFIFDCRSILNPGRIEEFKQQTGRD